MKGKTRPTIEEGKTRTTIEVDRELWSFVKQEATAKGKMMIEILEDILRERYKERLQK